MAIYWSWAWGNETITQLRNEMSWGGNSTNTSRIGPRTDRTYTYPGSPTRYGLGTWDSNYIETPPGTWLQKGIVAVPVYATSFWKNDYNDAAIIGSVGDQNAIYLHCSNPGAGTLSVRFDNYSFSFSDHVVSGSYSANDWHYCVMKYDHSLSSPTAEVWIDGTLQLQATASWSDAISTSGKYRIGGFSDDSSFPGGVIGQIVVYDTGSQVAGNFYDPVFCTRVEPTVDETGVGTFTPSVGSDNFAVLDSPFDSSIFTANTSSNAGDRVVCQSSGALGWYSQLGTTPTVINGLTTHVYASGSGQSGFAGVSNNNSTYATGTHFTPDISDPTYGWVTAGSEPSAGAAWTTASLLYVKYEVS